MTITVTSRKLDQSLAEDSFCDACQYLRQPRFAALLLNELITAPQQLYIEATGNPVGSSESGWHTPKQNKPQRASRVHRHLRCGQFTAPRCSARSYVDDQQRNPVKLYGSKPHDTYPLQALPQDLGQAYPHLSEQAELHQHPRKKGQLQLQARTRHAIEDTLTWQLRNKAFPDNQHGLVLP